MAGARLAGLLCLIMAAPTSSAIELQGHRGARGLAPENTLPGFELALGIGVDTLELDVGVTRDGVVVIHHDRRLNPDLARGPDGKWVSAPAPTIYSLSYKELQSYDVGRIRPGSEYARRFPHQRPIDGARIPRLRDLFELATDSKVRFNIETKLVAEAPEETLAPEPFARALIAEVRSAGVAARTTIQSFDWRALKIVEREAPEIATAYLTSGKNSDPAMVRDAGARLWSPDFRDLNNEKLAIARAGGLKIIAWTLNERSDIARALDMKVDGMISDYPDRVRDELKRRGMPLPQSRR
jgi:glycerophosphoryl diester phosphodiesterase